METNTETTKQEFDPWEVEDNFPERAKKERDYAVVPKGTRLMGLVAIKSYMKNVNYEGVKGQKPAYRFVFRDKEVTNAFLNVPANAAVKNNSALYQLVEELSGTPFTGAELEGRKKEFVKKSVLIERMKALVGGWFEVVVKHEAWKTDPTKTSPIGKSYEPLGKQEVNAVDYFSKIEVPLKSDTENGPNI